MGNLQETKKIVLSFNYLNYKKVLWDPQRLHAEQMNQLCKFFL